MKSLTNGERSPDPEKMSDIIKKEQALRRAILAAAGDRHVLVAFSGGVDSSLLLLASVQALGVERVTAVTASSPTSVPGELEEAARFAKAIGVRQRVLPSPECSDPAFVENPLDRCYVCKRIRYDLLQKLAVETDAAVVFDGTQADDDPEERPGMRAVTELGVRVPLFDAGLGKEDVRALLRAAGFGEMAQKQAQPCLATRIPSGTRITAEALERVGRGESLLKSYGIEIVRLRDHVPVARIVTDKAGLDRILGDERTRKGICQGLRELGYDHVAVDLEFYGEEVKR